ncbi:MAG: hypothetical protein PHT32_09115, partial [Candidatus Omnitrophica bacterium]|nr:hypothetical protein [Candidatus Omnitrophota bacterium]
MSYILSMAAFVLLFVTGLAVNIFTLEIKCVYILGIFWKMPIPVIYWGLAVIYALVHRALFKKDFNSSFAGIIKPWLLAELAVLLVDLKTTLGVSNPLNKVYMVYVMMVMFSIFAVVGYAAGRFIRNAIAGKCSWADMGLIYPMTFAAFAFLLPYSRFVSAFMIMTAAVCISFIADLEPLFRKASDMIRSLLADRWKFLLFVYVLALALRVMFGIILILQTGERFTVASCDGLSYDENAQMIAKNFKSLFDGSLVFVVFGPYYWVFLGLIYKIFG